MMGPKGKMVVTHRATNGLCWQNLGDLGKKSDVWPMDRFFGEQSAENEKKVIFCKKKWGRKWNIWGLLPGKSSFGHLLNFWAFSYEKDQPFLRQFLPELNFYITIYIFGKLKSGESFVILGPKLRVLSLKHGIYVLRTQELLLTKN